MPWIRSDNQEGVPVGGVRLVNTEGEPFPQVVSFKRALEIATWRVLDRPASDPTRVLLESPDGTVSDVTPEVAARYVGSNT